MYCTGNAVAVEATEFLNATCSESWSRRKTTGAEDSDSRMKRTGGLMVGYPLYSTRPPPGDCCMDSAQLLLHVAVRHRPGAFIPLVRSIPDTFFYFFFFVFFSFSFSYLLSVFRDTFHPPPPPPPHPSGLSFLTEIDAMQSTRSSSPFSFFFFVTCTQCRCRTMMS